MENWGQVLRFPLSPQGGSLPSLKALTKPSGDNQLRLLLPTQKCHCWRRAVCAGNGECGPRTRMLCNDIGLRRLYPFKVRVWVPALSFPSRVTLGMNVLELLCASGSSLV